MMAKLKAVGDGEPTILLATGQCAGEGFDDPKRDTLLLTMPISWTGTLLQYVGRIQRVHSSKTEVRVIDYVDRNCRVLARMFEKRAKGYRKLGYSSDGDATTPMKALQLQLSVGE
jgi:superfamily II DNA or RNA helicase